MEQDTASRIASVTARVGAHWPGVPDGDAVYPEDVLDPFQADVPPMDEDPESRVQFAIARADFAAREVAQATARRLRAIRDTLREARENPELFIPAGHGDDRDAIEFAVRAAVADLATALHVSPQSIRSGAAEAETLTTRLPATWAGLCEGTVSYPAARAILEHTEGLPDDGSADADAVWADYDVTLAARAADLPPARVREHARRLAERLAAEPLQARHARAEKDRRVWVEPAADGMAWFGALLPAEAAIRGKARIDAAVTQLKAQKNETRTVPQLGADVLADLLTGDGTDHAVRADVAVTVPAFTLMSIDETGTRVDDTRLRPGDLNGYGPIDPETARRLAASAPSFHRILTHPVTGAVLDLDRATYRPPADLRRWIRLTQPVCAFPGCGRRAADCDIDHSLDWGYQGKTAEANLSPLCRGDHRLKHKTRWTMRRGPDGSIRWTSPTGREHDPDPPPF